MGAARIDPVFAVSAKDPLCLARAEKARNKWPDAKGGGAEGSSVDQISLSSLA
jgi:hypothetical protein